MPSSCLGRFQARTRRSRSIDRQMSPATLTPTRANATRNIHRRYRSRRWFVNVIGGIYRGRPMNELGRRTLRYRRRSRQRSSIVATDERSRSNWRTSQNVRRRRRLTHSFVGNISWTNSLGLRTKYGRRRSKRRSRRETWR